MKPISSMSAMAVFLSLAATLVDSREAFADEWKRDVQPFFEAYCHACHARGSAEGGLDLAALGTELADERTLASWIRIFDRIRLREMPPADAEQPAPARRANVTRALEPVLTAAHASHKGTVLRRLNRSEYQNTLNDLFGTHLQLAEFLPEDGRAGEFDNVGAALSVSMVQLQQYLDAMDAVLNAAIATTLEKPASSIVRASYAEGRDAGNFLGKSWLKLDDGAVVFFKDFGYPSGTLREASVRESGRYKVRITGYAYQSDEPITFAVNGDTYARGAEKPNFGYFSVPPGKPTTIEFETWIEARYMIQIKTWGISDRFEIKRVGLENYRGPGLAIQHIEIEGPLVEEFPSRGHRLMFDGLNRREVPPGNPNDRNRPWYRPKFEISSSDPQRDVVPVLQRIAARAFRRPVKTGDVEPYLQLLQSELERGAALEEALRTAVTAIFCSPDFLYLVENPGRLDDHALAARLSYFLTRSAPDNALRSAADSGRLTADPTLLRVQTERLLEHPHASRFVNDFTDAWLNLREIDFTSPDSILFPEFDPFLKDSALQESRAFWRELIDGNLRVRNLVKSDFSLLNNRLAVHYGIDGVRGPQLRRVTLPPGSPRGGFLSQASVLKVSANGTNTSPVVRGVWVMERMLGESPPPPPPGIPGVEPDIRGAETLRELLAKHRNVESCRTCHEMIDPPGFALESFNPVGGWRERYRSLGDGEPVALEVAGRKVRYKLGPPVDASGRLPNGTEFSGFLEFRDHLAEDEDRLAKSLVTKLLTFATGREMGFSDRVEIDRLVRESAANGHGVRDLIHLVVGSEIFRNK